MHRQGKVKVCYEKTLEELGLNFNDLDIRSHKKIIVECMRCNEIFQRERRNLHQLHECPAYQTRADGTKYKWCTCCNMFLSYKRFNTDIAKHDKMSFICKKCSKQIPNAEHNAKYANFIIDNTIRPRFECKILHPDARLPYRKRTTDAGYDVYSVEDIEIPARGYINVPIGLAISAPEGWYYGIESRSSMFKKGIVAFNGTIDATYCDQVFVGLSNYNDEPYKISKGDRIAQFIVHKIHSIDITVVEEFSDEYNLRGKDGWGSSGK